jgi:hypothetical protein
MAVSMLLIGVVPLIAGVAIGILAMQGVLAALEIAVTKTLAATTEDVAAEPVAEPAFQGTPAVVIPFNRDRRERTADADQTRIAA